MDQAGAPKGAEVNKASDAKIPLFLAALRRACRQTGCILQPGREGEMVILEADAKEIDKYLRDLTPRRPATEPVSKSEEKDGKKT